jgi:DNA replication protein DnaC
MDRRKGQYSKQLTAHGKQFIAGRGSLKSDNCSLFAVCCLLLHALLLIAMSLCTICDGVGLVRAMNNEGGWVTRPCACQELVREERRLNAAHVPGRYRDCSLDAYEIYHGSHRSLGEALLTARKFVDSYPVDTAGKGLLLTGSIGVGKTHLAVGVLQRLVRERGVKGLFCDYRELLKNIQNSYNAQVHTTELELLQPVFNAEVLVLDDLGAQKPNEWVWDTVALILNSRYNDKLTTIITTNYPDLPAGGGAKTDAERAAREPSLGDRIGDRMLSRLAEMCIRIEMHGKDFRKTDVKRARFG